MPLSLPDKGSRTRLTFRFEISRIRGQVMNHNIETPWGQVEADPAELQLGELIVTDEGAELEVIGLDPLTFDLAPEVDEDWGE